MIALIRSTVNPLPFRGWLVAGFFSLRACGNLLVLPMICESFGRRNSAFWYVFLSPVGAGLF